jgi:hypothetical protein
MTGNAARLRKVGRRQKGRRRRPRDVGLLHGPYTPQPLRRGDRAPCLVRDADVVVTGWSDARISWPRCRAVGRQGGSGLLVDEELARAVRLESSLALQYWFGIGSETVSRWRRLLGAPNRCSGWLVGF